MSVDEGPRPVTTQEAQAELVEMGPAWDGTWHKKYAHTVATEPARTRAAVLEALRKAERRMFGTTDGDLVGGDSDLPAGELRRLFWLPYGDNGEPPADAIENGADW